MIEAYSNNLAVNAGDTINFSTSIRTNNNMSLSGNAIVIRTAGVYKVTFTGNFVATSEGVAGVQLYTNGTAFSRGKAEATATAGGIANLAFANTIQVTNAPTGNIATITLVNSIAGTWNLADVIVEKLS